MYTEPTKRTFVNYLIYCLICDHLASVVGRYENVSSCEVSVDKVFTGEVLESLCNLLTVV